MDIDKPQSKKRGAGDDINQPIVKRCRRGDLERAANNTHRMDSNVSSNIEPIPGPSTLTDFERNLLLARSSVQPNLAGRYLPRWSTNDSAFGWPQQGSFRELCNSLPHNERIIRSHSLPLGSPSFNNWRVCNHVVDDEDLNEWEVNMKIVMNCLGLPYPGDVNDDENKDS